MLLFSAVYCSTGVLGRLVLVSWALALTGCAFEGAHGARAKYVLVAANTRLPYWQTALSGLKRAGLELRVQTEMIGPATYDVQAEHDAFERAVEARPAGILVSVTDAILLNPDITAALAQNIPVMTVDADSPQSRRLAFIGTDNYEAGVLGGRLTARLLAGHGSVAVFSMPNQSNTNDRLHGYEAAFESFPAIKITDVIDVKGDARVAEANATRIMRESAKVDAFVCLEALACPTIAGIVQREGFSGRIKVVAMDTDERTLTLIRTGIISATVAQKPFTMAYLGVKLLDQVHHSLPQTLLADWTHDLSSPFPSFVDTGTAVIDAETLGGVRLSQDGANRPYPSIAYGNTGRKR